MAGYSGTPLPKKLGLKEGSRLLLIGAPPGFSATLGELPAGVESSSQADVEADVIVFFTMERREVEEGFVPLTEHLAKGSGLWIAWPKKASGVPTNLTEDILREVCLPAGLVDNKVCAIDETWSGLRFVRRKPAK